MQCYFISIILKMQNIFIMIVFNKPSFETSIEILDKSKY